MDEQEKEIEEILRTFDKAPSPSSERNNQAQMRQNHLQSRQATKKTTDAERTARTSNQTAYKRQPQSSKGRYLSPMAEKRRDNKGRVLRSGESQRSDGKYEYKYADSNGERHSVYSWKLVATDKVPEGKQGGTSLRDMEKQIQKDLEDNLLIYQTRKMTLNSFWDQYIELKKELKESTRTNYIYMYDNYVRPDFGKKNITTIKYSDVKKFYISLIHDRGFKPNSMEIINTILHPVFTSAVRDGYIRSNPSDGVMADIKKSHTWEKPKRHALTEQQQTKFVEFTAQSYQYKHWLPLFTVLLGTGGRIGEILGLRWEDCDFQDNIININHTLIYRKYTDEASHFAITTPKTKSGVRIIPMLSDVKAALTEEYKAQLESGFNTSEVDGYSRLIQSLIRLKNSLTAQGRCTDAVDDILYKVLSAKRRKFKIKYI